MKFLLLFGVLLVGGIGTYLFFAFPSYSWHQKMTIEVEADGKVYSGSSVVRVRWRKNDPLGASNGPSWIKSVKGEGPFVEIPGHGLVFALLDPPAGFGYTENLAFNVLGNELWSLPVGARYAAVKNVSGTDFTLPTSLLPSFVTFSDVSDPTSVQLIDPRDFAASFGPGVLLRSVKFEITEAPITTAHINRFLGWWSKATTGMLDGNNIHRFDAKNKLANSLTRSNFKRN